MCALHQLRLAIVAHGQVKGEEEEGVRETAYTQLIARLQALEQPESQASPTLSATSLSMHYGSGEFPPLGVQLVVSTNVLHPPSSLTEGDGEADIYQSSAEANLRRTGPCIGDVEGNCNSPPYASGGNQATLVC